MNMLVGWEASHLLLRVRARVREADGTRAGALPARRPLASPLRRGGFQARPGEHARAGGGSRSHFLVLVRARAREDLMGRLSGDRTGDGPIRLALCSWAGWVSAFRPSLILRPWDGSAKFLQTVNDILGIGNASRSLAQAAVLAKDASETDAHRREPPRIRHRQMPPAGRPAHPTDAQAGEKPRICPDTLAAVARSWPTRPNASRL
jgi:hypothetical protein